MPLPSDPKTVEVSEKLVKVLQQVSGPHPGIRPAHAKGVLLKGTFTPTAEAKALSVAPHFSSPSTPVIARFSSSTGIPEIPDNDPNGNPRGFAIRFMLAETPRRVHTDIVSHSVDAFPATTGEETFEVFTAIKNGTIGDYLGSHPKALAFVQAPKPFPSAFGREKYFAINAFEFEGPEGQKTFIRYRFVPVAGEDHLEDAEATAKSPSYLFDGVGETLKSGPIKFYLTAQIAEEGDVTNDNTQKWPESRKFVTLGTISLESLMEDQTAEQKRIIFDPIPRVAGIKESDDPLLQARAGVYLISGRERRAA